MTSVQCKDKTTNRTELRSAFAFDEHVGEVDLGQVRVVQQRFDKLVAEL
jgi:hypothetical protein